MDKNRKLLIGVLAGVVLLCAVIGITGASFRAGMMMNGRGNMVGFGQRTVPQAVRPAAPQDDAPAAPSVAPAPQQDQRQNKGRGFDQNNNGNNDGNNRFDARANGGRGWSPFGFIGGIFRFIGTLFLIGLIFFFIRMVFFKRGWGGFSRFGWGGPGGHRGMPPFFEEWHKRAHEPQAAPDATASDLTASDLTASDAPKPAEGDASGPAVEIKPDDKPQDPQAI